MKIKALILALLLMWVVVLPCSAATVKGSGVNMDIPDEYIIITPSTTSQYASAAKVLGFTDKTLKAHMEDSGMLFLALMGNNTRQIQFREQIGAEDSFVAKIGDLSLLDNENIRESASVLIGLMNLPEDSEYEVVANSGGIKAIKITVTDQDTMSVQYVTVRNGRLYSLVGFDAVGSSMDYLADIFETLEIQRSRSKFNLTQGAQIATTVIVVLLIVVAVLVIVRLIISFVTDFKNRDNDVREFVRIKRRKF